MRKLLGYLKGYKWQAMLAPLFKLLEACFELIVPLIVAAIIDNGIKGGAGVQYVINCCLILAALGAVGLVCAVSAQYLLADRRARHGQNDNQNDQRRQPDTVRRKSCVKAVYAFAVHSFRRNGYGVFNKR